MSTPPLDNSQFESLLAQQLTVLDVPEPPPSLDQHVRQRLNRLLLINHLLDLLLGALPRVFITLVNPLTHLIEYTLTGRFRRTPPSEDDHLEGNRN
jgi:hypothetical protein